MNYIRLYLSIFVITFLLAFGVYFWLPQYRLYLLEEDQLIENISASLFFFSFLSGLIFTKIKINKVNKKETIIVSVISLLGFLDELSFGERQFNLEMRDLYGVKIDSVHDLFYLAYHLVFDRPEKYFDVVQILSFLLVAAVSYSFFLLFKYWSKLKEITIRNYRRPPFIFLALFILLVVLSLVIDLDIIENEILFVIEELFEMNAALALLFWCFSLQEQSSKLERSYQ